MIVAQAVDASSETRVVAGMLEQAKAQGEIEEALFDAGYHCKGVLEATEQHEVELLCPQGQSQGASWDKQSEKYYLKSRFQYDAQRDSYRCPQGQELTRLSEYKGSEQYPGYVLYSTLACGGARSAVTVPKVPRDAASSGMRKMRRRSNCVRRWRSRKPVSVT